MKYYNKRGSYYGNGFSIFMHQKLKSTDTDNMTPSMHSYFDLKTCVPVQN